MAVIAVQLAGRAYEVRVGQGLIENLPEHCGSLLRKRRVPIVTDVHVAQAWRAPIDAALASAGLEPSWLVHQAGERAKSWEGLATTLDWLIAEEVERGDHVIALGGGVVGDLTGFAAAILKRGCGFVQIPTTLLAQVDSSVGGKTAINTQAGKNLVGAFHQPALVLADLDTLGTLPDREMRAGFAEVLKYGVLGDSAFFAWCEMNSGAVLQRDPRALDYAVTESVKAKARIVAADERETTGTRALLNLGHTFGHALEAETGFSDRLLHGEAVALGIVLAARYSARQGLIADDDARRISLLVERSGLPADIGSLELECDGRRLADHMLHDKKMDAGVLPFVLLRGIGQSFLDREVDLADIAGFLDEELRTH